jgi:predicted transcriptional regulator
MIRANTPTTSKRKPRHSDPVTDDRPLSEVFFSMSDDQKDAVIRRQLEDSAAGRFVTPTPEEQAHHDAVLAGVRRGRKGKSRRRITLGVSSDLLARLDGIAKQHGETRARLIESVILDFVVGLEQRRARTRAVQKKASK